ncbi:MAG: slipin family protein [Desulfurococcales archaeon]|nr:slipin family protein [Desulfurococcales archaeon]
MNIFELTIIFVFVVIVLPLLAASIKIVREYERAVIFRLGRLLGAKGPGLFFIIPFVDNFIRIDLRVVTVDVPKQDIITKDNVSVSVDAVIYYRVVDPVAAVVKVANYNYAITMLGQTVLRDVVGQAELDDLLQRREDINKKIQAMLDEVTMPWGIKVVSVTIKSVELPENMTRAMAKQAEAERWRRARIIEAEGERQAAAKLGEAALIYEQHPAAMRLRELQTLVEVAREKSLVIVTEQGAVNIGSTAAVAKAINDRARKQGRE